MSVIRRTFPYRVLDLFHSVVNKQDGTDNAINKASESSGLAGMFGWRGNMST